MRLISGGAIPNLGNSLRLPIPKELRWFEALRERLCAIGVESFQPVPTVCHRVRGSSVPQGSPCAFPLIQPRIQPHQNISLADIVGRSKWPLRPQRSSDYLIKG